MKKFVGEMGNRANPRDRSLAHETPLNSVEDGLLLISIHGSKTVFMVLFERLMWSLADVAVRLDIQRQSGIDVAARYLRIPVANSKWAARGYACSNTLPAHSPQIFSGAAAVDKHHQQSDGGFGWNARLA